MNIWYSSGSFGEHANHVPSKNQSKHS